MKTILTKIKFIYLVSFSIIFIGLSCTEIGIDDILERSNPNFNPRVETLIENFPANDGLSIDVSGKLYASNFAGFRGTQVFKVNPKNSSIIDSITGLRAPTGNVTDKFGNTYIVNNVRRISTESQLLEGDVIKVSRDGIKTVFATLPGFPSGITLDNNGNLYVSNYAFQGVHKISNNGDVSIFARNPLLGGGVGIDFDDENNLYVGNFVSGNIIKIDTANNISVFATLPTVVNGTVIGYITYGFNSIFATAIGENVIYKIDMDGNASIFAGNKEQQTLDGNLLESSFNLPNGIVADEVRKVIYVSEASPDGSLRVIKLK